MVPAGSLPCYRVHKSLTLVPILSQLNLISGPFIA